MGISGKQIAIGTGVVLGSALLLGVAVRARRGPLSGLKVVSRVRKNGRTMTVYRGNVGIEGRLMLIEKKVSDAIKDPSTRTLATKITASCPREDDACNAQRIFDYVVENVKYVKDPAPILHEDGTVDAVDMYNGADYTLNEAKAGDCANQVAALGALLGSIGVRSFSRAAGYKHGGPYSHVYRVADIPGKGRVALDTTLKPPVFGKELPAVKTFDFPKI